MSLGEKFNFKSFNFIVFRRTTKEKETMLSKSVTKVRVKLNLVEKCL